MLKVASVGELLRRCVSISTFFVALLLCTAAKANASQIDDVSVTSLSNGLTRVTVSFDQPPRAYKPVGRGALEIAVSFPGSTVSSSVPVEVKGSGPIRSVRVAKFGESSIVDVLLALPVATQLRLDGAKLFIEFATPRSTPTGYEASAPTSDGFSTSSIEVVPLRYGDLSEIVGVLVAGQTLAPNDTFVAQPSQLGGATASINGSGAGFQQPSVAGSSPGLTSFGASNSQSLGQKINENIAIDRRLNAIILSGTPEVVARIKAAIEKLDVPLPSVSLETQIVELSDSAAKQIGIDFTSGGQIANGSLNARTGSVPTLSGNLQAAVYDAVSSGGGRILARPRIVALNGNSASILTGDAIPIVTNILLGGATTAVQQQVQYVQVGVNLQIQPRIGDDGFVTSHVYAEVSSVTGYSQGYPQISQRVATTSATVRDGDSFVIGGLFQQDELRSLQKIPVLGDLPLIGALFRYRNDSSVTTNLYIVVTPHIIKDHSNPLQRDPVTAHR